MFNLNLARTLKVTGLVLTASTLLLCGQQVMAEAQDLAGIVGNVQTNIQTLAPLLTIVAYISGIGFCIAGIVQFKAHKDNPTQVPLSKPMVYLGVGAALLFLPSIMASAGQTVFKGGDSAGKGSTGLE